MPFSLDFSLFYSSLLSTKYLLVVFPLFHGVFPFFSWLLLGEIYELKGFIEHESPSLTGALQSLVSANWRHQQILFLQVSGCRDEVLFLHGRMTSHGTASDLSSAWHP